MIERLALLCVEEDVLESDNLDWFVYGLEKRITTLMTAVLFLALGTYISSFFTALSFLLSFYFLRVRTNGYHARTFGHCLLLSLVLEAFFLIGILHILHTVLSCILLLLSLLIVLFFAPVNNENISLTKEELFACRDSARSRAAVLTILAAAALFFGVEEVGAGIVLGNTMTALLLITASVTNTEKIL